MSTNIKQFISNMDSKMATIELKLNKRKQYKECNTYLPKDLPFITKTEAIKAYKKLITKFGKKKIWCNYHQKWVNRKMAIRYYDKKPRRCWIAISGNSSTLDKGWRRLIHDVSHMVHSFLRPSFKDHCFQQAELELAMIKYAVEKNWLNGVLKPKVVILSKDEKRNKKLEHYQKLISKWQTKLKLANTFIRKYNKKVKYLNKQ